jgi:hypothetical protein
MIGLVTFGKVTFTDFTGKINVDANFLMEFADSSLLWGFAEVYFAARCFPLVFGVFLAVNKQEFFWESKMRQPAS